MDSDEGGEWHMDTLSLPPSLFMKPHHRHDWIPHQRVLNLREEERPASAPPPSKPYATTEQYNVNDVPAVGPSPISGRMRSQITPHRVLSDTQIQPTSKDARGGTSLDLMAHFQRSGASVVKTRSGSVLSRGFILKTDHYPSGSSLKYGPFISRC